jgi:hypothetical protein
MGGAERDDEGEIQAHGMKLGMVPSLAIVETARAEVEL